MGHVWGFWGGRRGEALMGGIGENVIIIFINIVFGTICKQCDIYMYLCLINISFYAHVLCGIITDWLPIHQLHDRIM